MPCLGSSSGAGRTTHPSRCCELPPAAGKQSSEGVEVAWKSGRISACSFRRLRDGLELGWPIFRALPKELRCPPREHSAFLRPWAAVWTVPGPGKVQRPCQRLDQSLQESQQRGSEEEQDRASRDPPPITPPSDSEEWLSPSKRGESCHAWEPHMEGVAVASWEGEAESPRPQGTWQHLSLG